MRRADYLIGCAILSGVLAADGADIAEVASAPAGSAPPFILPSEIPGVGDIAWTRFADEVRTERRDDGALVRRDPRQVSASNGLGMFEIRARRLADLGLVGDLSAVRDPETGRMVWVADFIPPLTARKFLSDLRLQYQTFADSVRSYARDLRSGEIESPDDAEMSLSGQLALLHRCGPSGLRTWATAPRFPSTVDFFQRANGIF